ncbi:uncharacterized protein LOC132888794 [Neoarius graeffei]|uniref:uncharacterized protein LOC132888794 n=1 Tax=Neoarius graeffei TaxID=443677 RepID=UPI00298BDA71|nr:uncharacterized protein LOC132888794 [Neoarius graeffei]
MTTLNSITQLKESQFGQPRPRHGLKLLHWFACDCLSFNQNNVMLSHCCPKNGDFGFHTYDNRYGGLLPVVAFPYYEVGNLNKPGASNLPAYVQNDYTHRPDKSNMDRIIVSLNNKSFVKVYVTEHSDWSNFNKQATYCISKDLIKTIKALALNEFLLQTGYLNPQANSFATGPVEPPCPGPTTMSICSPVQEICMKKDIHAEIISPSVLTKNNTQEHHKAPPASSICSPTIMPCTIQDIQKEIESPPIVMKNSTQKHNEDSPATSICIPETTSSTTQDIQKEIETTCNLMKNSTQEHHKAPPAPSICIPETTSSTNQDIYSAETESPSNLTNNNMQMHTTTEKTELNNFVQDNTIQTFRNSLRNLQTPSKDIQTTSTSTLTIMSAKNQNTDIKPSPFSQMNLFFWGVYFLFLCVFFLFFWGNVMRLLLLVIFASSLLPWQNWNGGEQGQTKEREGRKSTAQERKGTGTEMEMKENESRNALCDHLHTIWRVLKDPKSFPVLSMNSFFWGFYFLFLFYVLLFWRKVMHLIIIVFSFALLEKQNRKKNDFPFGRNTVRINN